MEGNIITIHLREAKYGRQSASVNRRKAGRNGKAAVCHLFQNGKEIGERWKEYLVESQAEIDELQKSYELAKKGGDQKEIRKSGKKLANAKRERTLMNSRFKDLTETTAVHKHPHLHGYLFCV